MTQVAKLFQEVVPQSHLNEIVEFGISKKKQSPGKIIIHIYFEEILSTEKRKAFNASYKFVSDPEDTDLDTLVLEIYSDKGDCRIVLDTSIAE